MAHQQQPEWSGCFINLEVQLRRRQRMETQLAELPWAGAHRRFAAHMATPAEAASLGLASPGEGALLHVLEDDAVLHPELAAGARAVFAAVPELQVLFTEAFLTPQLYLALLPDHLQVGQALARGSDPAAGGGPWNFRRGAECS